MKRTATDHLRRRIRGTILVAVFLVPWTATANGPSLLSEYQAACKRIESTLESKAYQNAPEAQQGRLLQKHLFKGIKRKEVANAFRAITAAAPSERYGILKEAIEEETGKEWDCPSLVEIMKQG